MQYREHLIRFFVTEKTSLFLLSSKSKICSLPLIAVKCIAFHPRFDFVFKRRFYSCYQTVEIHTFHISCFCRQGAKLSRSPLNVVSSTLIKSVIFNDFDAFIIALKISLEPPSAAQWSKVCPTLSRDVKILKSLLSFFWRIFFCSKYSKAVKAPFRQCFLNSDHRQKSSKIAHSQVDHVLWWKCLQSYNYIKFQ